MPKPKKRTRDKLKSGWRQFAGKLDEAAVGIPSENIVHEWAYHVSSETEVSPGVVVVDADSKIRLDTQRGNLELFELDPLEHRRRWFRSDCETPHTSVEFLKLLESLWEGAEQFLEEHPIGDKPVEEADISKCDDCFPVELSKAQKNATEIFRCIREIQSLLLSAKPIYQTTGPIQFRPNGFEGGWPPAPWYRPDRINNVQALEKLFAEAMLLMRAVMSVEFYRDIWPLVESKAAQLAKARRNRAPRPQEHGKLRIAIVDVLKKDLSIKPRHVITELKRAWEKHNIKIMRIGKRVLWKELTVDDVVLMKKETLTKDEEKQLREGMKHYPRFDSLVWECKESLHSL